MGKVKDELSGIFGKKGNVAEVKKPETQPEKDVPHAEKPPKEDVIDNSLDDAIKEVEKKCAEKKDVQDASLDYSFQGVDYSIRSAGGRVPKALPGKNHILKKAAAKIVKKVKKPKRHRVKYPARHARKQSAKKYRAKPTAADIIGKLRPDVKVITLSNIHSSVRKEKEVPEHFRKTDEKIEKIEELLNNKIPILRTSLQGMMGQMDSHRNAMDDVNRREEEMKGEINDVKESINILRDEVIRAVERKSVKGQSIDRMMDDTAKEINHKVNAMSRELEHSFDIMRKRIDESAKTGKLEMASNIEYLKSQIDSIKSDVEDMKKPDIKKVKRERKHAKMPKKAKNQKPADALKKKEAPEESTKIIEEKIISENPEVSIVDTVRIGDISSFSGKEVIVEGQPSLTKVVEEGESKMYGYSIKDDSGEIMMTSTSELSNEKMKLRCMVNETGGGKLYLRFIEISK
ncbi:MAG: hypothetical protein JW789_02605 [Candidatus Aenigmarchaeota archaeon]|nr:hypothetical protein [Candidatus Aenigmarchaeota archaeon]